MLWKPNIKELITNVFNLLGDDLDAEYNALYASGSNNSCFILAIFNLYSFTSFLPKPSKV